jgi:hypothetical protein
MNTDLEIKEAIRRLLLPIPSDTEDKCIPSVKSILAGQQVEEPMYPTYIKLKQEAWKDGEIEDPTLKNIIEEILKTANPNFGQIISYKYFRIHHALTDNLFLSFELATILLSHLRLIITLAKEEDMSAAKIIKVLKSIDNRLSEISWKEVQGILSTLGFKPELRKEKVELLYEEDKRLETEFFADSGLEDACYQIGEIARGLHFQGNAEALLKTLAVGGAVHLPYLQVLHYQCLIAGFYDHEATRTYEFAPRGIVANWLFEKWNSLVSTVNPFLNNLKAVDVLDENWSRSKKHGEIEQASALVELLKGLDGLGFAALKELSSWIRRFLIRYINLKTVPVVNVPSALNNSQLTKIFKVLTSAPTATFGILEQRTVDLFASLLHPKENGWRSRGLGDPVNANNLSKRKLGDCDFQDSTSKEIVAYEAHGGTLSNVYFEGHMRTLVRSLQRRKEELESIADFADWKIRIVFVAYGFKEKLPSKVYVEEIEIKIEFVTFEKLVQNVDLTTRKFLDFLKPCFIDVINDRRTPAFVRERIISIS